MARPEGVVRRAGPADHPAGCKIGDNGHDDGAEGFSSDVGYRVKRDLAALVGGGVAELESGKAVGEFMEDEGDEKNDVPNCR